MKKVRFIPNHKKLKCWACSGKKKKCRFCKGTGMWTEESYWLEYNGIAFQVDGLK